LKNRWNRSTVRRPGPRRSGPPVHGTTLNGGRPSMICGVYLIQTKGYAASNPGRWSIDRRWRSAPARPTAVRQGNPTAPLSSGHLAGALWLGRSGAANAMGKKEKQRGDHKGAHLGHQTAHRAMVEARGGSSGLRWWRWLNVGVLRLQEDDGKLRSNILVLPPASITMSGGESVVHDNG
jgi:hypothetical protein